MSYPAEDVADEAPVASASRLKPGSGAVDRQSMILRALLLLCVSLAWMGCPIMEELDKSSAAMDRYDKTKEPDDSSSVQETHPPGSFAEKKAQVQDGMKQWWRDARSLNTGEVDEGIVRCQIHGSTGYMQRDDCLSRGGEPRSAG